MAEDGELSRCGHRAQAHGARPLIRRKESRQPGDGDASPQMRCQGRVRLCGAPGSEMKGRAHSQTGGRTRGTAVGELAPTPRLRGQVSGQWARLQHQPDEGHSPNQVTTNQQQRADCPQDAGRGGPVRPPTVLPPEGPKELALRGPGGCCSWWRSRQDRGRQWDVPQGFCRQGPVLTLQGQRGRVGGQL